MRGASSIALLLGRKELNMAVCVSAAPRAQELDGTMCSTRAAHAVYAGPAGTGISPSQKIVTGGGQLV